MAEIKSIEKYEPSEQPTLAIVLGSGNDFDGKAEQAIKIIHEAQKMYPKWTYRVGVSSAHRSPERTHKIAKGMEKDNTKAVLAIGGAAFALPGVLASFAPSLPVFSLPLGGNDAYLSGTNMPPSTPVASFGINDFKIAANYMVNYMNEICYPTKEYEINDIVIKAHGDDVSKEIAHKIEKEIKPFMEGLPEKMALLVGVGLAETYVPAHAARISLANDGVDHVGVLAVKESEEIFMRSDKLSEHKIALPVIGQPGLGTNAGLQIVRMWSRFFPRKDNELAEKLNDYAKKQAKKVISADEELHQKMTAKGWVPIER